MFGIFKLSVERVSIGTIDLDLREHGKSDRVTFGAKFCDFLFGSGFLQAKLIARKAKHTKPLTSVSFIEGLKALVLGRVSATTCCIYNQQDVISVMCQIRFGAVNSRDFGVVINFHIKIRNRCIYG